jgi:tetratricopeptide (TPR) repeat protein
MFKILQSLFSKKDKNKLNLTKESKVITKEIIQSLEDGIKLSDEKNYEAALKKFDTAIDSGNYKEAYRERGYCLQLLGFHLDAIDDFSKAIELFPQNANNYFGRSLSYGRLGYFDQAIEDAQKAIELSKIISTENSELNQIANEKNIMYPTFLYEDYLEQFKNRRKQTNPLIRNAYISPEIRRDLNKS